MDSTLVALFGSCAIEFFPKPSAYCVSTGVDDAAPFGSDKILCSIGFMVVLLFSIPLGYFNLDDNIIIQKVACVALLLLVIVWCAFFGERGFDSGSLDFFGQHDYTTLVGTVMFNYTFVTSIPSWVNEKKPRVSVNKSIWATTVTG